MDDCQHPELEGTATLRGICKKCRRDLDLWYQYKRLSEDYFKLWVKSTAFSHALSPCCKTTIELTGELEREWRCTKCKKQL